MHKLIASIATILSLIPTAAFALPKAPIRNAARTNVNQTYLTILNRALTQGAPAYIDLSSQDKLSYGHYTCQALNAKVSLDTIYFDYVQALVRDVPLEMRQQAGFFLGSSMYAGVYSFCPKYLPQLDKWGKQRFAQQ